MRSKLSVCVLLSALVCLLPGAALAKKSSKKKPSTTYYLALGDSLSRGAQPNAAGKTVPTDQGYANFIYASEKKKIKGLKLEELGCLGETTTSMLNGGVFCHYSAGSQEKAALKFIAKHRVVLITLDIGANDIDNCVSLSTGAIDTTCISTGTTTIGTNLPIITKELRKAAGSKVKMAGMTYYDPFLADYLTGAMGQQEASLSVLLGKQVNGTLSSDYAAQKFGVADVATAFDVYVPFTSTVSVPSLGGTVPIAVAQTCALTWMCAAAPLGPNIHANVAGYKEIAKVFAAAL